jgi:vacuolar protein sorting-associated protein 13B
LLFLQAAVNGHGEQQQLYCPGTVDHSHKLTFKLDNGVLPSNPYVPLSYTLIEQRKYLKTDDVEIYIEEIFAYQKEVKRTLGTYLGY